MGVVRVGSHTIETSNEDKILFPASNITKGDIITYYHAISRRMLAYMKQRPLTMHRFPNGIDKEGFFQKDASDYFPDWIDRISIKKKEGGSTDYVLCDNAATLVYLANQGCITPHLWLSKEDKLHYPDRMIFDLDPSDDDFHSVKSGALLLKKILDALKLPSFVMTTGSRGLHVYVPLKRTLTFEHVRAYARSIAEHMVALDPSSMTIEVRKDQRKSKLFIDYLRNGFTATAVAPYAVRARERAPVATPLAWREISRLTSSEKYTIKTLFKRLSRIKDPWHDMMKSAVSLKSYPLPW